MCIRDRTRPPCCSDTTRSTLLSPLPVSYTHLDVYKRQTQTNPGIFSSGAMCFGFIRYPYIVISLSLIHICKSFYCPKPGTNLSESGEKVCPFMGISICPLTIQRRFFFLYCISTVVVSPSTRASEDLSLIHI